MKNIITVKVYDLDRDREYIPDNLQEYIAWLQGKLEFIPEEFRHTARTCIYGDESYGSPTLAYTIEYDRPETDEEEAYRMQKQQEAEDNLALRELETLRKLKAKYNC